MMSDTFFRFNSADQDKKLDAELVEVSGLALHRLRFILSGKSPENLELDDEDPEVLYVGTAAPGTATTDP